MITKQKSQSQLTDLKPIEVVHNKSHNVSPIVKVQNVSITDSVLSENFQENGGTITLNESILDNYGRVINKIYVPPVRATYDMGDTIAILPQIAIKANTILRVDEAVKKGTQTVAALTKSVHNYYVQLSKELFGKNGVYNRFILGPRAKNTFRAVIVPGIYKDDLLGQSYQWIGLPAKIFNELDLIHGDLVIIGRDPTIWSGSLELLYAYKVEHDSIAIHPLMLPQLGGDHDGDQVWGYKVPTKYSSGIIDSISWSTEKYSKWGNNFNDNKETDEPAWPIETFADDETSRIRTTGLSISPTDIVTNSKSLRRVMTYCGKGTRARGKAEYSELLKACTGQPIADWLEETRMINMANLAMKVYMGPVGLLSTRLTVLGHNEEHISEACDLLAEKCSQSLLDAKHLSLSDLKNFKPDTIFKILNMTDRTIKSSNEMYKKLVDILAIDTRVRPLVDFLWNDGRGLSNLSKEEYKLFEGITFTGESAEGGYTPDFIFDPSEAKDEGIFTHAFFHGTSE
jgi:hypothetical protein